MRLSVLSLAVLSASATAQAPLEFNGVGIGAPVAALLERNPAFDCLPTVCSLYPESSFSKICGYGPIRDECVRRLIRDSMWGGVLPKSYTVGLRNGAIDSVTIRFPQISFQRIAAGLIEKYGPPTKDVTERAQNRMGATFEDRRIQWDRPDGSITAAQRAGTLDVSDVIMKSAALVAAERAGAVTSPKVTAKSL